MPEKKRFLIFMMFTSMQGNKIPIYIFLLVSEVNFPENRFELGIRLTYNFRVLYRASEIRVDLNHFFANITQKTFLFLSEPE